MQLRVVVCVLALSAGLVAGEIYHIPTVSMATPDNSSCPSDTDLEAIKSELSNKLSAVLAETVKCGTSDWKQVALINMTDPDQTCPAAWRQYDTIRACGRRERIAGSCDSIRFSSDGYGYTRVCGRITGYQFSSTNGGRHIAYSPDNPENAINDPYLDGVSITYGTPRKHIWSFYAEIDAFSCCSTRHVNYTASLGFIGNDSFCDTGNPTNLPWRDTLFTEHPLWDGLTGCARSDTCCTPHSGPWFHTTLPRPTIADIEVRICGDQSTNDEDTPVELLEIYVKQ